MFPFLEHIKKEDHRIFRIDAVSAAYYGIFLGFLNPFVPVLLKRLGASSLEMGLSLAAPFITLLIMFPLFRYLDGFRALDLVVVPTIVSRASVAAIGFLDSSTAILAVYMVCMLVEGMGIAPYTRVLHQMYSESGRSLAMGYVRAWGGGCQILGAFLGGAMLDNGYGWLVFLLAGLCGSISSLNFRRIFNDQESPLFVSQSMGLRDVGECLRSSPGFFWLNLTIMFFGFGNLVVVAVLPTLLVTRFDISNFAVGNLNGLTFVMTVVSYLLLGRYIARKGPKNGLLLGLTAGVLNPWLFLLAPAVPYLAVPYAFNGLMYAGFDLSWMLLIISYVKPEQISRFAAVYTFLMGIRGIIATMASNLALPSLGSDLLLGIGGVATCLGLGIGIWKRDRW